MSSPGRERGRARARELCGQYVAAGDPLGWFEALYSEARASDAVVPWADLAPNASLVEWHRRNAYDFHGRRCLTVGCGLGDDAEYLASAGAEVVAFDIAPTAIGWCRARFPDSRVRYIQADLLAPPSAWTSGFDFVLEAYTLQVLPPDLRRRALHVIGGFLAAAGTLLVLCRGRDAGDPPGLMPWPLTREELVTLEGTGLQPHTFEDYFDTETPPVRRFRVTFRRPA